MLKRSLSVSELEDKYLMELSYMERFEPPPPPSPSTLLQMPGAWPVTLSDPAMRDPVSPAASFFSTVRSFVPIVSLANLFCLPFAVAQRFLRPQRVRAEPVPSKDGARKKRLIDLGAGDPVVPVPASPRARKIERIRRRVAARKAQRELQSSPSTIELSPTVPGAFPDSPEVGPPTSARTCMLDVVSVDHENTFVNDFSFSDLGTPDWESYTPGWESYSSTPSPCPIRINRSPEIRADADKSGITMERDSIPVGATYENDPSELPDAPRPPPKKSVSWHTKLRSKTFFYDAAVTDMLDSSVAIIKDCSDPATAKARYMSAPVNDEILPVGSPPKSDSSDDEYGGFRGVLVDIWFDDEDSLEESTMSNELICELYDEAEKKLKLKLALPQPAPTPAPAPAVTIKPLVSCLTDDERKTLDAVSKATDYGRNVRADVVPGKLTAHDFGTLLPSMFNGHKCAWVNDNIVNEYLNILIKDLKQKEGYQHKKNGPAPRVHAFASQWYTSMKANKDNVARWAFRKQLGGKNFLDAELVLFPVCDGNHWRLLAIKPKDRLIEIFDSLHGGGAELAKRALDYLQMELKHLFVPSEWHVSTEMKSEKQKNSSDCGVFTLLNALVLLRKDEHDRVLVTDGMHDARRRIATTLLTGHPTTEMD